MLLRTAARRVAAARHVVRRVLLTTDSTRCRKHCRIKKRSPRGAKAFGAFLG